MVMEALGKPGGAGMPFLPMPGGDAAGIKWLIAAVLAAGKDGCSCDSCKLLKRFGADMSQAMLKEQSVG